MSFKNASIEKDGRKLHLSILELSNSILAFLYEGNMKLGTLAIALPSLAESRVITSSILLGGRHLLSARALAERTTSIFGKMSLASVHVELSENEGTRIAATLLDELSKKRHD